MMTRRPRVHAQTHCVSPLRAPPSAPASPLNAVANNTKLRFATRELVRLPAGCVRAVPRTTYADASLVRVSY